MEQVACEICERKFDTQKKLDGHIYHCKKKHEEIEEKRAERVPFGLKESKWNTPSDDGYHYRVFNDNWKKEPGRVQRAMAAGYEVVENEHQHSSVGTNDDGSEIKAVLMRIPEKFYKEDQAAKYKKLDEKEKQIKRGKFDDKLTHTYGDVEIKTEKGVI